MAQGLIASGMGQGRSLALLLTGPALSLPNMLVIRSVMGRRKTVVFGSLVIVLTNITGYLFGTLEFQMSGSHLCERHTGRFFLQHGPRSVIVGIENTLKDKWRPK